MNNPKWNFVWVKNPKFGQPGSWFALAANQPPQGPFPSKPAAQAAMQP